MKKIFTLLLFFSLTRGLFAQAPEAISYQALARDLSGNAIVNTQIALKISILQTTSTGSAIYVETFSTTTNGSGLFSLELGKGTVVSGVFSAINWGAGPYFAKVEFDPANGTNWAFMGTSQLLSVPYSLYSKKSGDLQVPGQATGKLLAFNGSNWVAGSIGITGGNIPISIMPPSLAVTFVIALEGIFPSRNMGSEPTIAEIDMFGGNFAPRGYATCDGQIQSIAQNTALFSLLGTTYGGNGQTTFALPDFRGRFPMHWGQGPGLPLYVIGETSGTTSVTLLISNLPQHTHPVVAP